jgi:lipoyl(octanoyl) transferase
MKTVDLGRISYRKAERLQLETLDAVMNGGEETLFLLEHPPVITLGRNGGEENLLVSRKALEARGVEVVQSTRGGNITCHFPGQLVGYPVFRIDRRPGGLKNFFVDVEGAIIATLARFGVAAESREGFPGVWVGPKKIASIGIAVKRWTTYHGLALNIGSDLSLFDLITLCGLQDTAPTSLHLERGDESVTMQEVKDVLREEIGTVFANSSLAQDQAASGRKL